MEGRAGESGESSRPVVAVVREAGNPVMTASAAPHESGEEGAAGFGAAEHFQQGAPPGFAAFAYEQAGQQQQQQLYHMLHPPSDESPYDRVTPPAPDHHHQGYSQQQLAPPPQSSSSQLVFDGFQGVQGGAAGQSGTLGPVRAGGSLVNFGKIVQNRNGMDVDSAKLEKKRERNRIAATKCRMRKLEKISSLEKQVAQLKRENDNLRRERQGLSQELDGLRSELTGHLERGCPLAGDGGEGGDAARMALLGSEGDGFGQMLSDAAVEGGSGAGGALQ